MEAESELFVGREQELDVLGDALSLAKNCKGRMVFISGNPGTGKTMLVNKFLSEVEADPQVSMWRVKLEDDTSKEDSFFVFRDLFEKVFVDEEKRRAKKEFANDLLKFSKIFINLVPVVGSALCEAIGQLNESFAKDFEKEKAKEVQKDPSSEAERFALTFEIISSIIERVGCGIVFIDDIQWIDVTSAYMLKRLSKEIDSLSLLLICTYRPGELRQRKEVNEVVNNKILQDRNPLTIPIKKVELKALGEKHVNSLISALYHGREFDPVFVSEIYNRTKGNPLFVKQLVKLLEDRGVITKQGEFHRPVGEIDYRELPGDLRSTIWQRIANLKDGSDNDFRIHMYGSMIGELFDASDLKRLLPEPDLPHLDERLPQLPRLYCLLISALDLTGKPSSYAFLHSLIYQTLQQFIEYQIEPLYVELHRKVALQLEAKHRGELDRTFLLKIVKHFEEGRVPQKALEHLRKAAATARRDGAYYELVSIDERIIGLIEQNEEGSPVDLQETYVDLGKSYEILGWKDAAVKVLDKAVQLAVESQDDLRKALAQTYLSISLFHAGKFDESMQVVTEALDTYRLYKDKLEGVDLTTYGIALNWAGINHRNKSDMDAAISLHKQAINVAQRSGDKRLEAHARANIGAVYMWQKELERVVPEWESALQLSEEIDDQPWIAHYTIDLGLVLFLKKDYDEALEQLDKGIALAKEGYFEDNIARGMMNKASVYFVKGRLKEAEDLYLDALEVSQEANVARLVWRIEHNLGNVCLKRRGAEDINHAEEYYISAVRKLEDMLKDFKSDKDRLGFIEHRLNPFRALIKLYLELDREDTANEYVNRGIDKSLIEYQQHRRQGIDLAREEQENKNFNFIDGFYVETE